MREKSRHKKYRFPVIRLPASWLRDHQLTDVPDDVLHHEMQADGVGVVGEDTHQPLEEECSALVLGELHRPPGHRHHDGLK